jgi:hypothetical protein
MRFPKPLVAVILLANVNSLRWALPRVPMLIKSFNPHQLRLVECIMGGSIGVRAAELGYRDVLEVLDYRSPALADSAYKFGHEELGKWLNPNYWPDITNYCIQAIRRGDWRVFRLYSGKSDIHKIATNTVRCDQLGMLLELEGWSCENIFYIACYNSYEIVRWLLINRPGTKLYADGGFESACITRNYRIANILVPHVSPVTIDRLKKIAKKSNNTSLGLYLSRLAFIF